jgi:hypothetical protein
MIELTVVVKAVLWASGWILFGSGYLQPWQPQQQNPRFKMTKM